MPLCVLRTRNTYKYKYSDPKKVLKSGKNKGKRPKLIRTAGKSRTVLDIDKLANLLTRLNQLGKTRITIEQQYSVSGRSKTIYQNYGILLGCLFTAFPDSNVTEVAPSKWKKALGLSSDKNASIRYYNEYYGKTKLRHDIVEAILISHINTRNKKMDKKLISAKLASAKALLNEIEIAINGDGDALQALALKMKELGFITYRASISNPVLAARVEEALADLSDIPTELEQYINDYKANTDDKDDGDGEDTKPAKKAKKPKDDETSRKVEQLKRLKAKQDKKKAKKDKKKDKKKKSKK